MNDNKEFLISVIIPVYNVEDYLQECLESVSSQSIGMENIQVILINDGSPDDSEAVCLRFRDRYPDNVVYIAQENAGVAAARNKGIELAAGRLTTFLDGDDKWSPDAFETASRAADANPDIEVFSCKMEFFDAETGDHQLNYKYGSDRIIDIREIHDYPQLSSSSVFIRTDVVKDHGYTEGLRYSEDFRFINEIILETGRYMVLKDPVYYYRRRQSGSSAIQSSVSAADYYIPTVENVYKHLFALSLEKYREVIRYMQFCVMYDLRARLKLPLADSGLSDADAEKYVSLLKELLSQIDDDIILEQKRIALCVQLYALELKYGEPLGGRLKADGSGLISYMDRPVFDIPRKTIIRVTDVALSENGQDMIISGTVTIPFYEKRFSLHYYVNDVRHDLPLTKTNKDAKTYLFGVLRSDYDFEITVPTDPRSGLAGETEVRFEACFDDVAVTSRPKCSTGTSLDGKLGNVSLGDSLIYRKGTSMIITRASISNKASALFQRLKRP